MGNRVKHVLFHLFSFVLVIGVQVVQGSPHHNHHHHRHHKLGFSKLFVFGDSYADTGNNRKSEASSWHQPYGITFPGKPVGRYSDGRVLTDYLASFVGIKSPVPYRWRNVATKRLRYGVNFAYGGTGVFDTLVPDPNMTTQIDFFQQLIHDGVYNKSNLNSSIALVSLAGNDYTTYMAKNGTAEGLSAFTISIINQLAINLKRIQGLGVKKVAVTAVEPIGCLPQSAASSSYQQCNETNNMAAMFHNLLLQQAVEKLNNETKGSTFMVLDLFNAFMSMFNRQKDHPGIMKFGNLLKPCCVGTSAEYSCGDIDENGVKKYTVCENPESTFFWDDVHPSQEGWHAVYSALQISLDQLYI